MSKQRNHPGSAPNGAEMLHGHEAIGKFLGLTSRQAKHRAATGEIPTFKMGRSVCARKPTLLAWIAECEAAARKGHR